MIRDILHCVVILIHWVRMFAETIAYRSLKNRKEEKKRKVNDFSDRSTVRRSLITFFSSGRCAALR